MKDNLKRSVLIYIMGFAAARASFMGINPLAIGFFAAAYMEKVSPGVLFVVILAGVGSVMQPTVVLKYLLAMIASVVFLESPLIKNRDIPDKLRFYIPAVCLGIFAAMEAAAGGWNTELTVLAFLEAVIAYVSGLIFSMGIGFVIKQPKGSKITNEEMISLSIIMAVVICGIPSVGGSYIAPVETAVYFIILLITYKYGAGQGAITGAVSGIAMSLRGAPLNGIGWLAMMGIIPALFRSLGRIPVAAVFSLTMAIIGIVYKDASITVKDMGAASSAIVLFLLLPRSIIYRIDREDDETGRYSLTVDNIKKLANTRMRTLSESFLKLSKILETISERQFKFNQREIDLIFEDVSERLCKNCRNCSFCWEAHFNEAYQAACDLFEAAQQKGYVEDMDVPIYFAENCIYPNELVLETNKGLEIAKLNSIWGNRLAESREVIAGQLKEVSSAIHSLTGDIYGAARVMRSEENKVSRALRSRHVDVKSVTVLERPDKRKEIILNAAVGKRRCITTKEAAGWISEALGVKFVVSAASKLVFSKNYEDYIFLEDTKFKVLTGVARAMMNNISGDSFSIMKLDSGEEVIALADGMGTGKEAADESETVLALLEQLLEAGFKTETAIRLINSNLVLKADKQTFSTIDIGTINLCTGTCEFVKIGAASTFIKRESWVETISSTTLPIGMFKSVDYDAVTKKLYEGDIIIMVTDGVLDCLQADDKEACMEKAIMDIKSSNPQEIANRVLDFALSHRNYVPVDDMTVVTAGIWLKQV